MTEPAGAPRRSPLPPEGTSPPSQVAPRGLVGSSPALRHAIEQAQLVGPLDVSVLLLGPSGVGKTRLARLIHGLGPRRSGPLVELNCAALPEALLESELFGAVAGAHSTAVHALPGKVAAAEGGTLVLDEVSELSWGSQGKLLQLLQSKKYFPLGATRAAVADVRILAACNADLAARVRGRRFREDLFYRLNLLPIRLPALSERREDVAPLAESFRASASQRHGLPPLPFSDEAQLALRDAEWPGNLRQLANAVEAGLIRAAGARAAAIDTAHLFPSVVAPVEPATLSEAVHAFQGRYVAQVLDETGWSIPAATELLGVSRSTLYNLIRRHRLRRPNGAR